MFTHRVGLLSRTARQPLAHLQLDQSHTQSGANQKQQRTMTTIIASLARLTEEILRIPRLSGELQICVRFSDDDDDDDSVLNQLATSLQANTSLKRLNFRRCNLNAAQGRVLFPAACSMQSLTQLNLWNNRLGDDGVEVLCASLAASQLSFRYLFLAGNGITSVGCFRLAEVLKANRVPLERLILDENPIGDEGVTALSAALPHNSTLAMLMLVCTECSNAGAIQLAKALYPGNNSSSSNVSRLSRLFLSENPKIGETGIEVLADMIQHNTTLCGLELRPNFQHATIDFYLKLNQVGRGRLSSLQQRMDAICGESDDLSFVFYFLQADPFLCECLRYACCKESFSRSSSANLDMLSSCG